ncbi:hypothetical protein M5K25_026225 [Dendrobium thyrsiflorum]|uniref:Uncharacterized protein n=1 Tax=Dendrobium thyrsiflorum TaxID=117978 RepID=A0ABD0TWP6_DENTH
MGFDGYGRARRIEGRIGSGGFDVRIKEAAGVGGFGLLKFQKRRREEAKGLMSGEMNGSCGWEEEKPKASFARHFNDPWAQSTSRSAGNLGSDRETEQVAGFRRDTRYLCFLFLILYRENNNIPCQKRKAALFITERTKRTKVNVSEVPVVFEACTISLHPNPSRRPHSQKISTVFNVFEMINGDHVVMDATASSKISVKGCLHPFKKIKPPVILIMSDSAGEDNCKPGNAEFHDELQKIKRSEEVMRNFARALLSTLRQYKDKLKESENEVQYLQESLRKQSAHAKEMEKELNELRNTRSCVSNPPVEECAKALSFKPDTYALRDENNLFLSPETSAKIEMGRETKALDESLSGKKTTGDSNEFSLPLHRKTLEQVDISAEAYSSLPSEENVELSYQHSDENSESFQKLTQSSEQVGEMDQVAMNFVDVASLKGPHSNAPVDASANEHQFIGKTANHSYCFTRPAVPLEREGYILRLPGNEDISIIQAEKESENEEQYLKKSLRKQSAHAKEMEKEMNETRNICSCVSNPPVEECAKALSFNPGVSVPPTPSDPDRMDTDAFRDENNSFLEQSGVKIALNENVQQSTASHSTEALKSEEDDPALRPLNSQRPKRMLLPASAIHFKDFNGLFMDENAMEVKRKKTANANARSDGSISLIRILKGNSKI